MSLPELAAYMLKLGCRQALNLDGGGSSTFWIHGQVMNSPCYGKERPMANALVLVRKPATAPAGGGSPAAPNGSGGGR
jgi:exopolysaccharide biosynthesis protein